MVLVFVFCALLVACSGCDPSPSSDIGGAEDRLVIASWNVQALFDGTESGTEYADYSAAAGWSDGKYRARLEAIGKAAASIVDGGPDVLALLETEHAGIARDLAEGPLSGMGYRWSAHAGAPGAALGMSVLSRRPIAKAVAHGSVEGGAEAPRPMLELRLEADGLPIALFVCHWKSKLGGGAETEALRRTSASALARRAARLAAEEPGLDLLAVGDLNENIDEFERVSGAYATALLPDTEEARRASCGATVPLVVTGFRPPVAERVPGALALYTPWHSSSWPGSYRYRGAWETIDHVLAASSLFDGAGWDFGAFSVADGPLFADGSGYPIAYSPRTGAGKSDHLPVVVELVRRR